jgi:hypothetical protein
VSNELRRAARRDIARARTTSDSIATLSRSDDPAASQAITQAPYVANCAPAWR